MNKVIVSIRKTELRFIILVFLLATVVGNSLNSIPFFVAICVMAATTSLIRYQFDKKWLESADKYVRIKLKRTYWKTGLLLIAALCIGLFYYEVWLQLRDKIGETTIFVWGVISIILSLGNYYHKFINSIKSFDDGIQLPGRRSEIILWNEIYQFKFEEKVIISSSKGEHEYTIDPDDVGFAQATITDWISKNGKRK